MGDIWLDIKTVKACENLSIFNDAILLTTCFMEPFLTNHAHDPVLTLLGIILRTVSGFANIANVTISPSFLFFFVLLCFWSSLVCFLQQCMKNVHHWLGDKREVWTYFLSGPSLSLELGVAWRKSFSVLLWQQLEGEQMPLLHLCQWPLPQSIHRYLAVV